MIFKAKETKHLVAACIKAKSNLPGQVVMPKVLVTRWIKQKKFNNYCRPKSGSRTVVQDVAVAATFDTAATIETFETVSIAKRGRGRPFKKVAESNGPALEVDNIIKNSKKSKKTIITRPNRKICLRDHLQDINLNNENYKKNF